LLSVTLAIHFVDRESDREQEQIRRRLTRAPHSTSSCTARCTKMHVLSHPSIAYTPLFPTIPLPTIAKPTRPPSPSVRRRLTRAPHSTSSCTARCTPSTLPSPPRGISKGALALCHSRDPQNARPLSSEYSLYTPVPDHPPPDTHPRAALDFELHRPLHAFNSPLSSTGNLQGLLDCSSKSSAARG
jgi:hypothetical protein